MEMDSTVGPLGNVEFWSKGDVPGFCCSVRSELDTNITATRGPSVSKYLCASLCLVFPL